MLYLLLILYCAWAFYAGYQFLSGRSLWLDDDAVLNRVVKLVASIAVGYVIVGSEMCIRDRFITHLSF